jgi:hypothetical protein
MPIASGWIISRLAAVPDDIDSVILITGSAGHFRQVSQPANRSQTNVQACGPFPPHHVDGSDG